MTCRSFKTEAEADEARTQLQAEGKEVRKFFLPFPGVWQLEVRIGSDASDVNAETYRERFQ